MDERKTDYKHLERERIISISDLFEEILRKIWLVIILAAAFAVICAGYKYMADKTKAETSTETASYEKTLSSLTDEEVREVDSILMLYEEAEASEQYLRESIRMNIDPFHEECVQMQFVLDAEDANLTDILQVLDNYISGTPLSVDLQDYYPDEDSTYLAELVFFDSESMTLDVSGAENIFYQSNIFSVNVIHMDEDSCQQLADVVQQCLDNYLEDISGYFGDCKITLIDKSSSQTYDCNLRAIQSSAVSDQISLLNKITTQTSYLSDSQVEVLETMLAGEVNEDESVSTTDSLENAATQTTVKVHISTRYLFIGLVIGIVLAVIIIVLYYIFRGTLNIPQELQNEFNIPVFGQLHIKKPKNPLVRLWRRIVNKRKMPPLETEQELAFINLKNFCSIHNLDKILFIGSRENLSENTWLKDVQASLKEAQIETEIEGEIIDSSVALEKLNEFSNVILVETLHKSIYRDVIREVEICEEQNIHIVGSIVMSD